MEISGAVRNYFRDIKENIQGFYNNVLDFYDGHNILFHYIIFPLIIFIIGSFLWNFYTKYENRKILRANIISDLDEADRLRLKNLFKEAFDKYKQIENSIRKNEFPALYGRLKLGISHCVGEFAYDGNRENNLLLAVNLSEEAMSVVNKMELPYRIEIPLGLSTLYLALASIKETEEYQEKAAAILDKLITDYSLQVSNDNPIFLRLLGDSYRILAQIKNSEENYKKAINTYEQALQMPSIGTDLRTFALTQNNLGCTYRNLAEITYKERVKYLALADKAFKAALTVFTVEYDPVLYAITIDNMGLTHWNLADIEDKTTNLDSAIKYYNKALQIRSKDKYPFEYATTINNIASALIKYDTGTATEVRDRLYKARDFLIEASKIHNIADHPIAYATKQNNLGNVYFSLGAVEERESNLEKAVSSLENALQILTLEKAPHYYRKIKRTLGNVYAAMSKLKNPDENKKKAISSYKESLNGISLEEDGTFLAVVYSKIGDLFYYHYKSSRKETDKIEAIEAYSKAIDGYKIDQNDIAIKAIQKRIHEQW